ncbi:DUF4089 domain-containing protein [Aestuariibius sp. 2305UL40-4]|uniref:DUF4089 domain-containing protein n=1 Tax=Aestuariibius violaceus TaxID=3234132 RepID=UPI00345E2BF1
MRTFLPPPPGFDATAYARDAARAIGLPIPESDIAEVALNLERTAGFAQLLAGIPGLDSEEPAPVFRAGEDEA